MLPYAFTIFTGAFLLFQVQPLIGKYILPWFGGGPGVWTTCLLFFQLLLLGGYAYAHFSSTRLKPRQQAAVHLGLLAAAVALLPITPSDSWKAHIAGDPTLHILLLLAVCIGLPYFVLSSTGPLMQQWFSRTDPGTPPYRLYALSNAGSLLALLSYPFYFEREFSRRTQAELWSAGLCVFVAGCAWCARRVWRHTPRETAAPAGGPMEPPTSRLDRFLWIALPAAASILLLATTNKLCQEVAVIPFLWVLPLSLYLLSFILCFDHPRWYRRGPFCALLAAGVGVIAYLLSAGNGAPLAQQIVGYTLTLFVACMICHGELYRLRPPPRSLTSYYLFIAAGGALGGVLVAVVAPLVFNEYWELQIGLWAVTYLLGVLCLRHRSTAFAFGLAAGAVLAVVAVPLLRAGAAESEGVRAEFAQFFRDYGLVLGLFGGVGVAALLDLRTVRWARAWRPRTVGFVLFCSVAAGIVFLVQMRRGETGVGDRRLVSASRNFYGTLKVYEYNPGSAHDRYYMLINGAITHGLQFRSFPQALWPTSYYGDTSGVGLALHYLEQNGRTRFGLVGLGAGTLAAQVHRGDSLRIYEINPAVKRLALGTFTYVPFSSAKVDLVMGDARLSMERELAEGRPQQLDLLALDAFTSDAIPVHLLTKEAFAIYLQELKPDGVIAVHTSNRYLNLRPVVENLARHFGLATATISDDSDADWWIYRTTWILVTRNLTLLDDDTIRHATDRTKEAAGNVGLWTDDHASLYEILK